MQHVDYKVEGGKLLRIDVEISEGIVNNIEIRGDFFVHPEEGLGKIEEEVEGCDLKEVREKAEKVIQSQGIEVVGFSPADLYGAVHSAYRR